ncbi:sensor domain-containing diguanylate cyclase [Arsenicicoccus dermatophilus]|uniref:sensor domain-containing diguanylate cyclase n=1 Tax=Arsenicicoccus dermatophilus TaxID=1076331 RepID=UPI001F4CF697|nr:diguanylate cyclase [Arsenicicoccus dermatophilus]
MPIRTRLGIALAAVILPALLLTGLFAGVFLPRSLLDGQRRDVDRATSALATAIGAECWALGDRAEVIALSVANGRPPQVVLTEETRGGLGAEQGYVVVTQGGKVIGTAGKPPARQPAALPTTRCSQVTSRAGAALAEQVTLRTDRGDLSVLVVEPLTPGRLDALARHAAVSDVRAVLLCAGSEVHPSADIGRGAIVRTVEAGPGRPCAVEGSAPDPTSGLRAWLPLIVLIAVLAGAALLVRWLARELTEPIVALSRGAQQVADGDLSVRLPDHRQDEIGELARDFNHMAAQLDRQMAELRDRRQTLHDTAHAIAATLQRTHDLDGLLTAVCALAETTTSSASASVWLREGAGLRLRVVHPIGTPRPPSSRVDLDEGIVGLAASERRVVMLDDATPCPSAVLDGRACAAPLVSGDHAVGVLVVERSAGQEAYDAETAELLEVVAGPAGVAMDNAMLHRTAQRQSVVDPLTGVGNLRMLTSALSREVARAQTFGRQLSLLVVDIDNFAALNQRYGHETGDGALRALAARLVELVPPVDTVARYAGEELAVLCPERGSEQALALADRLVADLRTRPLDVGGQMLPVTCSIGVATWPHDGATALDMLGAADDAMTAAKAAGRDRAATTGEHTTLD